MAVALAPLLVAVTLLAGYFAHREIDAAWIALEERGRAATQRLAEAAAFDLFAGNSVYLRRLLEYELANQGCEAIGIANQGAEWWLVSGKAGQLPARADPPVSGTWWSGGRIRFVHPVRLRNPVKDDPYIAGWEPVGETVIGQVTVVMSTAPVEAARRRVLLVSLGVAAVMLLGAGLLAWRLARGLIRPLHSVVAAVRGIAQGALDVRVAETSRGEIAELESGVNHMASVMQQNAQDMERRIEEATAELRTQKQAAEAAVLARSRFLAAASHDLRQPMNALTLLVEALKDKLPAGQSEASRLAENIEASAHSMQSLLNALLDLSRLDAGVVVARPECFAMDAVFRRLAEQYAPLAARKGLRLKVHVSRMTVFTDPVLLERILGNLIANAIRYTDRGGIVVGLRRVQKDWVRFEVWDSGKGIPEAFRERIFEEYFQLENPERGRDKGLGLGLAIVKRLARLLGSPVELRSVPGRGSCFCIRAVRCEPPAQPTEESVLPVFADAGGGQRKLVVFIDDDETILEAMATVFEQWGIDLAAGVDGHQVREELLELGRKPDAILTDYRLREGRTGIDAVLDLRETFGPDIPAALITGDTATTTLQAIGATGLPVLYKPIRPASLRAFLHHLLQGDTTPVSEQGRTPGP